MTYYLIKPSPSACSKPLTTSTTELVDFHIVRIFRSKQTSEWGSDSKCVAPYSHKMSQDHKFIGARVNDASIRGRQSQRFSAAGRRNASNAAIRRIICRHLNARGPTKIRTASYSTVDGITLIIVRDVVVGARSIERGLWWRFGFGDGRSDI